MVEEYELTLNQLTSSNKELETDLQLLYQTHEQEKMKFYS
jgi:hypothetical protein